MEGQTEKRVGVMIVTKKNLKVSSSKTNDLITPKGKLCSQNKNLITESQNRLHLINRNFENSKVALFSNFKKLQFQDFVKIVSHADNPARFIQEAVQLAEKWKQFVNDYRSKWQQVRLKYVLKMLGRPECQKALMEILGINSTSIFSYYADQLIEQNMIERVGLEMRKVKEVAEVYSKTKTRVRTSSYYQNVEEYDFERVYYTLIDNNLKRRVEEHKISFEELRREAKNIEDTKRLSVWEKCKKALQAWNVDRAETYRIRRYLCYELDIAPKPEKHFNEIFKILVDKKVLQLAPGSNRTFIIRKGE
jgi:hypothetical protein